MKNNKDNIKKADKQIKTNILDAEIMGVITGGRFATLPDEATVIGTNS